MNLGYKRIGIPCAWWCTSDNRLKTALDNLRVENRPSALKGKTGWDKLVQGNEVEPILRAWNPGSFVAQTEHVIRVEPYNSLNKLLIFPMIVLGRGPWGFSLQPNASADRYRGCRVVWTLPWLLRIVCSTLEWYFRLLRVDFVDSIKVGPIFIGLVFFRVLFLSDLIWEKMTRPEDVFEDNGSYKLHPWHPMGAWQKGRAVLGP